MSTLLTESIVSLRKCQRLSENDLMFYLRLRIMKLFLRPLSSFDVTVVRNKFILAFIVQLRKQALILDHSMCILLGLASPCDCTVWGGALPVLPTEKLSTDHM